MAQGPELGFDYPAQLVQQCGKCMISTFPWKNEEERQEQCVEPNVTYDDGEGEGPQPLGMSCENLIDMLTDSMMMQEEMMMEEEALAEEEMMMEEEAMGEEMAMPYIPADQMPENDDYTLIGDTTMVPSDKVKELQCFDYTLEGRTMEDVVMEAGNVCFAVSYTHLTLPTTPYV